MILLDTHVWVWWVSGSGELSHKAKRAIHRARSDQAILISSISVWELALLVQRGRLKLALDLNEWIAGVEQLPFLNFIAVDNNIALKSASLPGPLHPDLADRIIIATALICEAVLITKDQKLLRYPYVKSLW